MSGKKYKKCHLDADDAARRARAETNAATAREAKDAAPAKTRASLPRPRVERVTNKRPHKKTRK